MKLSSLPSLPPTTKRKTFAIPVGKISPTLERKTLYNREWKWNQYYLEGPPFYVVWKWRVWRKAIDRESVYLLH